MHLCSVFVQRLAFASDLATAVSAAHVRGAANRMIHNSACEANGMSQGMVLMRSHLCMLLAGTTAHSHLILSATRMFKGWKDHGDTDTSNCRHSFASLLVLLFNHRWCS